MSKPPSKNSDAPLEAPVLDKGFVRHVDEPNSDLKVVNAARVSFGRRSTSLSDADKKLIGYLARNHHWTPFAHCRFLCSVGDPVFFAMTLSFRGSKAAAGVQWEPEQKGHGFFVSFSAAHAPSFPGLRNALKEILPETTAALGSELNPSCLDVWPVCEWEKASSLTPVTLHLKMPIFVARQWMRSNHGIVYNEISRRYVDSAPEYHHPDHWRSRPPVGHTKQGSGDDYIDGFFCRCHYNPAGPAGNYQGLLNLGVAPEQARIILPLSTYTEFWMTASLSDYARVVALRDHPHAQSETLRYARTVSDLLRQLHGSLWTDLLTQARLAHEPAG